MPGGLYLILLFPLVLLLYVICNLLISLLCSYLVCTYDIDTIVVVFSSCSRCTCICSCFVLGASVSAGSPALMSCLALVYVDE